MGCEMILGEQCDQSHFCFFHMLCPCVAAIAVVDLVLFLLHRSIDCSPICSPGHSNLLSLPRHQSLLLILATSMLVVFSASMDNRKLAWLSRCPRRTSTVSSHAAPARFRSF